MAIRRITALRSGRIATAGVSAQRDRSRVIASQHRAATERYLFDFSPFLDGDTIRQFVVHPQSDDVVATVDLDAGTISVDVSNVVDSVTIQVRCQTTTRREQFSVLLIVNELAGDIPVSAPFAQTIIVIPAVWRWRGEATVLHQSPLLVEDESSGLEALVTETGELILTEAQP